MVIYRLTIATFSYDMAMQDRTTRMVVKLQTSTFKYNLFKTFKFQCLFFLSICYLVEIYFIVFPFHGFIIDVWWTHYGGLQILAIVEDILCIFVLYLCHVLSSLCICYVGSSWLYFIYIIILHYVKSAQSKQVRLAPCILKWYWGHVMYNKRL